MCGRWWRALPSAGYVQSLLSGRFFSERSLLLTVEMGCSALAASSPFSTHMCHCPVAAVNFFSFFKSQFLCVSLEMRGAMLPHCRGSCSPGSLSCVIATDTSLPATGWVLVGFVLFCFFKKNANQTPPAVPGLLPPWVFFSNLKMRRKKAAKCIFICQQSQDGPLTLPLPVLHC